MQSTPLSNNILWHRIKTGLYALAAIMFAGWLTDALNEDLMFRIITRQFFPEAVAQYEHPFSNTTSLLIWGVPIIVGFLLMLVATVMTIHHLKKRHIYVVTKGKKLKHADNVILYPPDDDLESALTAYQSASHIHIIHPDTKSASSIEDRVKKILADQPFTLHKMTNTHDLHSLTAQLAKLIHKLTDHTDQELAFDLKYTLPVVSSAAMYCSLETNLGLTYPEEGHINLFETDCEMEES